MTSAAATSRDGARAERGSPSLRSRRWLLWTGALALGGAVLGGAWCERGLSQARLLAKHALWSETHAPVDRYLWLHPTSVEANLLCAEALVKDDSLPIGRRVGGAVEHLRRIPDSAPEAAAARVAEARVHLFLNYSPTAAEGAIRRGLAIAPDDPDANYLRWKLLDLTRRSESAEPFFWKVYESKGPKERALILREWYLSQFYPVTSTMELDRKMAFRLTPSDDASGVESNRLLRFRDSEPRSPLCNAAMARWFRSEGDLQFALELLDKAAASMTGEELLDPFFRGTLIDVLLDLGELDRAGEEFDRWAPTDRGRDYLLARGRVLEDARDDPAGAGEAYGESLREWPGPIDWRTMHRAANSLARAGAQEGALAMRARAASLEQYMDDKLHGRLRMVLGQLDNPEALAEVVDFYRRIGRDREADAWSGYIKNLDRREESSGG